MPSADEEIDATLPVEHPGAAGAVTPAAPRQIGRYEIKGRLGAGGMGEVLLATDPVLGRRVALKVLRPGARDTDEARRRLVREAQSIAQVSHEHVIVVHEVGTHEGRVYVAMEYVAGSTLTRWQRGRDWREVVAMYTRAGRGLAAAHDAGLVHRDFKPDNVLVGDDGRVRVTDFGLVVAAGDAITPMSHSAVALRHDSELATSLTHTGAVLGTPRYMAPEQHLGQPVDARADQFAFCVALHEALHGEPPFAGATYALLVESVVAGRVLPVPAGTAVPAAIQRAVRRGLARQRDDRFPSMRALLDALAVPVRPPRPRWLLPALLAAAALAAGAVAVGYAIREDAADARRAADLARRRADALDRELIALKTQFDPAPASTAAPATGLALARERFERGQRDYAARRYDDAARAFLEAYAIRRMPQFLYNAAAAYHLQGKAGDRAALRSAVELYRQYLAAEPDAADRASVDRTIVALEAHLALDAATPPRQAPDAADAGP